jgi:hypothetical protein
MTIDKKVELLERIVRVLALTHLENEPSDYGTEAVHVSLAELDRDAEESG